MSAPSERIVDLYRRHARKWASDRGKQLVERVWLDRFLSFVPLGAAILDIGCGPGEPIGRYLIEQGHAVTGIDSAPEMIAMCKARMPGGDWLVADMRSLALQRTFGGLVAWDSFFHLDQENQRAMFAIFRAHAAAGAALMFTSGPSQGEVIGRLEGEPLYHASLSPEEYRALLAAQGFEVEAHAIEDPACGHRTIWLAKLG